MKDYRPYILPDGTEIPGRWYYNPKRFVSTEHGWRKLTAWAHDAGYMCERSASESWHFGHEFHHIYGRGAGKRDDRLPKLEWLCRKHHSETPIQRLKGNL
jgi:hypothetical protein